MQGINMIGEYCKQYRKSLGLKLKDVDTCNIKTLSAFESGRSTNIKHLEKYVMLSVVNGDNDKFMFGLLQVIIKDNK